MAGIPEVHLKNSKTTKPPKVFISYAHEGDLVQRVGALVDWLGENGVDVISDHAYPVKPPTLGWPTWMQQSIEDADVVLVVCSRRYKERFEKRNIERNAGAGVRWEGAIISQELYRNLMVNDKFYPVLPDDGLPQHMLPVLAAWENGFQFPSGNDRILQLVKPDDSVSGQTATAAEAASLADAVSEMAAELKKNAHLHWAFSVAWSMHHPDYPDVETGAFAPARDIAEAFLVSLKNYDACSLADVAHAVLIERDSHILPEQPLSEAEPENNEGSRHRAASDLVDFILRYLSRRRRHGEFGMDVTGENHKVTLQAREESAAEFCSADFDKREPVFLPLQRPSAILRSAYQVPKAPPGGIDLDGGLSALKVASDLAEMLIPEHGTFEPGKPNTRLWKALNNELWHLCTKKTGSDRGRYFIVFSDFDSLNAHNEQLVILKDKLKWLRYFVLDTEAIDNSDDSYRPLGDMLFRQQQMQHTASPDKE